MMQHRRLQDAGAAGEPGAGKRRFTRRGRDGAERVLVRGVPDEVPIAIECNGLGYAVLMATPLDLEDLAYGFALSERLADAASDVLDVGVHRADRGMILRITLSDARLPRVLERVRHRVSESSCGLCGIENLEQALRPLPRRIPRADIPAEAIFQARDALAAEQPLNAETGAVHAAALCSAVGAIRLVREDVGRHNAFDKLIGAMLRGSAAWDDGFALLTSRCSYELVEKAALSGCPLLATISAPTALALDRAAAAGVRLVCLARADSLLVA